MCFHSGDMSCDSLSNVSEYLNIHLLEVARSYHSALSRVDLSKYSQDSGEIRNVGIICQPEFVCNLHNYLV